MAFRHLVFLPADPAPCQLRHSTNLSSEISRLMFTRDVGNGILSISVRHEKVNHCSPRASVFSPATFGHPLYSVDAQQHIIPMPTNIVLINEMIKCEDVMKLPID